VGKKMISVNRNSMPLVEDLVKNAESYGCHAFTLKNGTTVIDMGHKVAGSWRAGQLFSEIDMAGLAKTSLVQYQLNEAYSIPAIEVYVDEPHLACLVSQIAAWPVSEGNFATIGSGPARALGVVDWDFYIQMSSYRDDFDKAVIGLQGSELPDETIANTIAEQCKVDPQNLFIMSHPNTCITCSIQVSARSVEQTIHQMIRKGFDLSTIVFARGIAPIAPVVLDETDAMGKINDCLLYGAQSEFWVKTTDEAITSVLPKLVTEYSKDYGKLFGQIFEEAGRDYYQIHHDVHAPAKVQIYNMNTGNMFVAGGTRNDLLIKSLFNNSGK
jgi:methenyltetrahydromethanopterin cyclohydrolase